MGVPTSGLVTSTEPPEGSRVPRAWTDCLAGGELWVASGEWSEFEDESPAPGGGRWLA